MTFDIVFQILILLMSVVLHEVAHGYAALYYGDHTAEYQGRLTLNPLRHLDPMGSIVVPIVSYLFGGFVFGWAKPVPYNPHNLKSGRWPEAFVALAGPLTNLMIALVFGVILRVGIHHAAGQGFLYITATIVFVNILLAVFNLMPLPPLDGSKLLFALFPQKLYEMRGFFERYGFVLVLIFILFIWQFVEPVVEVVFRLFTGVSY
jgi:Zn-dependent protease